MNFGGSALVRKAFSTFHFPLTSKMVKEDGLRASRRSFTKEELAHILREAGLVDYRIEWRWAFRYLTSVVV